MEQHLPAEPACQAAFHDLYDDAKSALNLIISLHSSMFEECSLATEEIRKERKKILLDLKGVLLKFRSKYKQSLFPEFPVSVGAIFAHSPIEAIIELSHGVFFTGTCLLDWEDWADLEYEYKIEKLLLFGSCYEQLVWLEGYLDAYRQLTLQNFTPALPASPDTFGDGTDPPAAESQTAAQNTLTAKPAPEKTFSPSTRPTWQRDSLWARWAAELEASGCEHICATIRDRWNALPEEEREKTEYPQKLPEGEYGAQRVRMALRRFNAAKQSPP